MFEIRFMSAYDETTKYFCLKLLCTNQIQQVYIYHDNAQLISSIIKYVSFAASCVYLAQLHAVARRQAEGIEC